MATRVEFVMRPADWLMLGILALLWGSSFFWTTIALDHWPAPWIVSARLICAATLMVGIMIIMRKPLPRDAYTWGVVAALGFLNNLLPFTAYTFSQVYINSSLAAVLNAFTPLSVLLLSQVFRLEDRMTLLNTTGAILGITGVFVLMLPGLQGQGWTQVIGVGFALGAAFCYAVGSLFARKHKAIDPQILATGMVGFAALYSIPSAFLLHGPMPALPKIEIVTVLIILGMFSTAIPYLIFFQLLKRVGPTNASTVALLLPLTALMLGILILGERFTPSVFIAIAMIFGGLIFIDGRVPKSAMRLIRRGS